MKDDHPHLAELFQRSTHAASHEGDPDDSLPTSDSAYTAFARRSNKPEFSLHFITPAGTMRSFQYAHLDSDSSFTAECILLRFMGTVPMKVLIQGRNLRQLYDYIHQHRTAWVRESARSIAADGEAVVTKVTITAIKENEGVEHPE